MSVEAALGSRGDSVWASLTEGVVELVRRLRKRKKEIPSVQLEKADALVKDLSVLTDEDLKVHFHALLTALMARASQKNALHETAKIKVSMVGTYQSATDKTIKETMPAVMTMQTALNAMKFKKRLRERIAARQAAGGEGGAAGAAGGRGLTPAVAAAAATLLKKSVAVAASAANKPATEATGVAKAVSDASKSVATKDGKSNDSAKGGVDQPFATTEPVQARKSGDTVSTNDKVTLVIGSKSPPPTEPPLQPPRDAATSPPVLSTSTGEPNSAAQATAMAARVQTHSVRPPAAPSPEPPGRTSSRANSQSNTLRAGNGAGGGGGGLTSSPSFRPTVPRPAPMSVLSKSSSESSTADEFLRAEAMASAIPASAVVTGTGSNGSSSGNGSSEGIAMPGSSGAARRGGGDGGGTTPDGPARPATAATVDPANCDSPASAATATDASDASTSGAP
jgi:hypothetical protein